LEGELRLGNGAAVKASSNPKGSGDPRSGLECWKEKRSQQTGRPGKVLIAVKEGL